VRALALARGRPAGWLALLGLRRRDMRPAAARIGHFSEGVGFRVTQWILPCQIDRTGARSITVISMGSVLLPADRSSSRALECPLDRALC
jgi:hypothetical protein